MSKSFVLAHLSDPHLGPLPQPAVRELASKRLVGYINWRRSRRRRHRRDALDAIIHDLHGRQPDHVAITGDLVNIALPAEFAHARRWLETLGRPADVSVVPGNHDAYVAAAALHRDQHWSPYMAGDAPLVGDGQGGGAWSYGLTVPLSPTPAPSQAAAPPPPYPPLSPTLPSPAGGGGLGRGTGESGEGEGSVTQQSDRGRQQPTSVAGGEAFPYFRRRGPVALIGVSTAIATPPFMATGKVGEQQIARIARMLGDLRTENVFRVVMIHHPPLPSARHKCLIDAIAFQRALAAAGAELIIHGHDHAHSLVWIAGDGGRIPVIGVPSASAAAATKQRAGAYNLYFIGGGPGAWSCEVVSRGLRSSGAVGELNRFALSW